MKNLILIFILLCNLGITTHAQGSKMPSLISDAFKSKFPEASEVNWVIEKDFATATFLIGSKHKIASFENSGQWLLIVSELGYSQLPAAITTSLAKNFKGFKIIESSLVETYNKATIYQIRIEKEEDENYINTYTIDGKLLGSEKEKDVD